MAVLTGGTTPSTYDVCGVRIAAMTRNQAASHIAERATTFSSLQVHLCNAYTLSLAPRDSRLRHALAVSDLNLPDGSPVAWLGARSGTRGPVRGPSLVGDVVRAGLPLGLRHYFYGGWPGVADSMSNALRAEHIGALVVGAEAPPNGYPAASEIVALAERIRSSHANVVWVGLGTPQQDYLVPELGALTHAVVIPVGAAFDFLAGSVPESPPWMQGTGTEWLYRLAREPRRLWRRYLFGNPRFVYSVAIHKFRHWRDRE